MPTRHAWRGVLLPEPQHEVARHDEVRRVVDLVGAAQDGFGVPVDVEFCFAGEELWLVQCRPVTTLHAAA